MSTPSTDVAFGSLVIDSCDVISVDGAGLSAVLDQKPHLSIRGCDITVRENGIDVTPVQRVFAGEDTTEKRTLALLDAIRARLTRIEEIIARQSREQGDGR